MISAVLAGCAGPVVRTKESTSLEYVDGNKLCGLLDTGKPLINVTVLLTASAKNDAEVYLFAAKDTSFESAMYVVQNCALLEIASIAPDKGFDFLNLPQGTYVAMMPRSSFGKVQGFPVVRWRNMSGVIVDTLWHGGNAAYSMCVFNVTPVSS